MTIPNDVKCDLPADVGPYEALSHIREQIAAGDLAGTETALCDARSRWPGNPVLAEEEVALLLRTGRGPEAIGLAQAVAISNPERPQSITRLAEALFHGGLYAEALEAISHAAVQPWTPALLALMIDCRLGLGQESEALHESRQWIVAQTNPLSLQYIIRRLLERNEKPFALALMRAAKERWPQDLGVLQTASRLAALNCSWLMAMGCLHQLVRLQPDNAAHHVQMANIQFQHLHRFEAALRSAIEAVRCDPALIDMRLLAVHLCYLTGDNERAATMALDCFEHPAATLEHRCMSASVLHACEAAPHIRAHVTKVLGDEFADGAKAPFLLLTHGVQVMIPASAGSVVMYFGGLNTTDGLTFGKLSAMLSARNVGLIFLQDYQRLFFMNGILSLAKDYTGTIDVLQRMLPRPGLRMLCIGVSAGGYAALHYGQALGAERMLLFSPLTDASEKAMRLDPRAKAVARRIMTGAPLMSDAERRRMAVDMRPQLESNAIMRRIDLWYGDAMPIDVVHAENLRGVDNVHLHAVPGFAGHDIVGHLQATGRLESILTTWLEEDVNGVDRAAM